MFTFPVTEGFAIENQSIGKASYKWLLQTVHFFPSSGLFTPRLLVVEIKSIAPQEQEHKWTEARAELDAQFNKLTSAQTNCEASSYFVYGIISIGEFVRFYQYDWETKMTRSLTSNDSTFHLGQQCSTVQGYLNYIKTH